jgi:hypothetical protein
MKLVLVAFVLAVAGAVAAAAYAYRAPTKTEKLQIVAAILAYQQHQDCQPDHTCHPQISHIKISLANTTYATATLYLPAVGSALALLHKRYGTWRVTELGEQFVGCDGKAPKAVPVDLELTCPGGK